MFASYLLRYLRGNRPTAGISDTLSRIRQVKTIDEFPALALKLRQDLTKLSTDASHAVCLLIAFALMMSMGVFFSATALLGLVKGIIATIGWLILVGTVAKVERDRVCALRDDVRAEVVSAVLTLGLGLCEDGVRLLAEHYYPHGFPESFGAEALPAVRRMFAICGLGLAASGSDFGFKLISAAHVVTNEVGSLGPTLASFVQPMLSGSRRLSRRFWPVGPSFVSSLGVPYIGSPSLGMATDRVVTAVTTLLAVVVLGGWTYLSSKTARKVSVPKVGPVKSELPIRTEHLGLGASEANRTDKRGARTIVNKTIHKTDKGGKIWEYEDDEGQFFFAGKFDEKFVTGKKDWIWQVMREEDHFPEEKSEFSVYGPQEAVPLSKSAKKRQRRKEKASHGEKESAMPNVTFNLEAVHQGVLRQKNGTSWSNAVLVRGAILFPTHVGVWNLKDWELVQGKKVYQLDGKMWSFKSDPSITYAKAPAGLKSTKLPRKTLAATKPGCLIHLDLGGDGTTAQRCSLGDVHAPVNGIGRHTCSTTNGHCCGVLLTHEDGAVAIVGLHGFGDNGSRTNGYHAMTPELIAEIDQGITFPKN